MLLLIEMNSILEFESLKQNFFWSTNRKSGQIERSVKLSNTFEAFIIVARVAGSVETKLFSNHRPTAPKHSLVVHQCSSTVVLCRQEYDSHVLGIWNTIFFPPVEFNDIFDALVSKPEPQGNFNEFK